MIFEGTKKSIFFWSGVDTSRVIGAGEAWLENYQTLMEYTDERIRVSGKYSEIQIEGYGMRIEYYGNIDMKIQGVIRKIQFEDYS